MKFVIVIALVIAATPAQAALPVTGKWLTAEKDSVIEIGTCGAKVCGKVLRVMKMMPNGQMPIDSKNPDAALRNRPVQGMMLLSGFTDGGNHWNGQIYNPRSGKTYKSKLSHNPDGSLKVQGCIGPFCQTFTWTAAR